MAQNRRTRIKVIPLAIGQDPSLWRYESVQEALNANTAILSELIRAGEVAHLETPETTEYVLDGDGDAAAAR